MTRRFLFLVCSFVLASACDNGATGVHADLNGRWRGNFPAGGQLTLNLQHSATVVSGIGVINDALGTGSLFATGSFERSALELTLELAPRTQDPNPCPAQLTGRLSAADRLGARFQDCDTNVEMTLARETN